MVTTLLVETSMPPFKVIVSTDDLSKLAPIGGLPAILPTQPCALEVVHKRQDVVVGTEGKAVECWLDVVFGKVG